MRNKDYLIQEIEKSIVMDFDAIISRQTDEDVRYEIDLHEIASKLSPHIFSFIISFAGSLSATPFIDYYHALKEVEEEESLVISQTEAKQILENAIIVFQEVEKTIDSSQFGSINKTQLLNLFDEEYKKIKKE